MSKIGEVADKYRILGQLRYFYFRVARLRSFSKEKEGINKRKQGKLDPKFIKLLNLKNKYDGERCFIIGTGPSLTVSDLELLNNEITFGVNSICKVIDQTKWRPTFFGIQDKGVYEKLEKQIVDNFSDNVFVSDSLCKKYNVPKNYICFPYTTNYKLYLNKYMEYSTKFSDDAYCIVYDGWTIVYSLIQIAIFMGFKELYLLGCDCSYPMGQKNHFIESGFVDRREYLNYEKMTTAYKEAKKYVDLHDIKIFNCTRGGMLEVFPRKSLEEVLNNT